MTEMTDIAISCKGVGKLYQIGGRESYKALRDTIADAMSMPFRLLRSTFTGADTKGRTKEPASGETFWALKDLSLEIKRGAAVGIIGRNGAGKSTLLKVLSRITAPTTGEVKIHGRVGSLLEVGTGFHPELTGRENIFLNGAILGMRKTDIERKFDEIVSFAEVDRFIDTPVKRYSSGMYVRLAFAVAAHLEPEILVVDEVLAVGDAAFQKKCLGKIGDVSKDGRTVLFVSHNMTAVQSLCRNALWLDGGSIVEYGAASDVVSSYLQVTIESCTEQVWSDPQTAPGNDSVRLHRARVVSSEGNRHNVIDTQTPFRLEFSFWNLKPEVRLNLSLMIYNQEGACVFATTSIGEPKWHGRPFPCGLFQSVCHVPGNLLNDGLYRAVLLLVRDTVNILHVFQDVITFEVQDSIAGRGEWYGKWPGTVRPMLEWQTDYLEDVVQKATR